MEDFKTVFVAALSSLAAYLAPIYGMLFSVIIVFLLKFAVGYITSKRIDKEDFSFKKAFSSIIEATVFFVLVSCTFSIGEHMDNQSGALQSISMVTYALLYFYAVNVFKNLKRLFPLCQWIAFIYYVISIEFINRISFMEAFLKEKKQ